jgi:hypothetical protein
VCAEIPRDWREEEDPEMKEQLKPVRWEREANASLQQSIRERRTELYVCCLSHWKRSCYNQVKGGHGALYDKKYYKLTMVQRNFGG